MIYITLEGQVPSKKNGKRIMRTKSGVPFIMSSKNHNDWHKVSLLKIQSQFTHTLEEPYCVTINMQFGDNRKVDLSNKVESLMDLLVDAGVISDDNRFVVPKLVVSSLGYKKGEWETNITIEHYEAL